MNTSIAVHWFRRDLRLADNTALKAAFNSGLPVMPVFIFDTNILDALSSTKDARVSFIHKELTEIKTTLEKQYSSTLFVFHGTPEHVLENLIGSFQVAAVYTNEDYEPYAVNRDAVIKSLLESRGVAFLTYKDHVIFAKSEVVKSDGKPYTIFTPYRKKWLNRLEESNITLNTPEESRATFMIATSLAIPALEAIGFQKSMMDFPSKKIDNEMISVYDHKRDFPSLNGTSRLGLHLRFGTISIRQLVLEARKANSVYLNELIWREFFQQILWHFPFIVTSSFKRQYDVIEWRNDEKEFSAWCNGMTGYPLVDAGMRELNTTGYMHNRVRMVVACFLAKNLLIDWRWGEAYFAEKLLDFELANNNGNWQWAAGTGCDAAPYFRIFNPLEQARKFDPESEYIRQWIPELDTSGYPPPIVDYKMTRQRALKTYREALERADKAEQGTSWKK